MPAAEDKSPRLRRHGFDENVQLTSADQAVILSRIFAQAEIEVARLVGFDHLAGSGPHLGFDAAAAHCSQHRAIFADQQLGAFIARNGAVYLNDGRDRALLAESPETHDFVVNVHSAQLYLGASGSATIPFLPSKCFRAGNATALS